MATVFLCEDERLGRRVAVKRLHPYGTADDVAKRFEREARLGASLNHPGLVAVFDTVPDEEGDLIVMEYVPGETLGEALKRGPLSSERALSVVTAVAAALDHAHAHGILHRDIKPGNILLREDGVVKLADLGIATAAEQTRITKSGTLLGTAAYMAPEQLEGGEAGPLSDVYALAAVAFEAFGGRKARLGPTPFDVARQIATEPPPDLREAWPEAPADAANALARAMARRPEDRQASAGELARDLQRALERPQPRPAPKRAAVSPTEPLPPREPLLAPTGAPRGSVPAATPRRRARWLPGVALAAVLIVAAIMVVAIGGGNPDEGGDSAGAGGDGPAGAGTENQRKPAREKPAKAPSPAPAEESAPEETASEPASLGGEESGAALNAQGFELMQSGSYEEAIPILQRAVDAFPAGTSDLNYAYALYNLGRSLRLAGRFDEAIPILEQRLEIPNQTETVERELALARSSSTRP